MNLLEGKAFPSLQPPAAFSATPSSGDTPQRPEAFKKNDAEEFLP